MRKVQTGPELGMASLAQRISERSRCPGDDQRCTNASMKGARSEIEGVNFDVLIFARCRMGFVRNAKRTAFSTLPHQHCVLVAQRGAPSKADGATTARKLLHDVGDPT